MPKDRIPELIKKKAKQAGVSLDWINSKDTIDFESKKVLKESESLLQKSILQWLNYQEGVFAFRVNVQGVPLHNKQGQFRPSPHRGVADVIACVGGSFLAIEVKSKKGKLSEHQKRFMEDVTQGGGHFITARSLDEVIEVIAHLKHGLSS